MILRKQKLTAAGLVLAVGFAMALLFRRGSEGGEASHTAVAPPAITRSKGTTLATLPAAPVAGQTILNGQFSPLPPVAATNAGLVTPTSDASTGAAPVTPLHQTVATTASGSTTIAPTTLSVGGAPLGDAAAADPAAPAFRIHVVHNGDTLERLAERYLGDAGRSLELFDLNRDVLENPHLLPIGAQLHIPGAAAGDED